MLIHFIDQFNKLIFMNVINQSKKIKNLIQIINNKLSK